MNLFTKSLLVSSSLLLGTYEVYGMENPYEGEKKQNPIHIGKNKATYVFNNSISYKEGQFKARSDGKQRFTAPHNPGKFQIQSTEIYAGHPTNMPYEEKLLMRIKNGQDGRVRIQDTTAWPHVIHAQLEMRYASGNYGGSGILVGPHHILTAAHNVYSNDTKEWAQDISVCLGLNGKAAPFGTLKVVKAHTFKQWVNEHNKSFDIALLVLDRSIGSEIGWSGLLSLDDESLLKEEVHVTGYPGDKGFTKMMTMSQKLKSVEPEQFYYDIDTYGGQSGSGIWINKWGMPYTIGIHTLGEGILNTGNSGVRLSHHKFEKIIRWISKSLLLPQSSPPEEPGKTGWFKLPKMTFVTDLFSQLSIFKTVNWDKYAAEQGFATAQFNLGVKYANGEGVRKDDKEDVKWYTMAANQGHASAQSNLGVMYTNGRGVTKDDKEAIKWYKLSAKQGDADAQFSLGEMYNKGKGVPKDDMEAVKWYKLSAEQGDADAQALFNTGGQYCGW